MPDESSLTDIAYGFIGFYSVGSVEIIPYIIPSVMLGIPLGTYLIRLMDPETFRRICMAFDGLRVEKPTTAWLHHYLTMAGSVL